MITPVEIESQVFKTGFGYDKKEVDSFLANISSDYETLYTHNVDCNEKIDALQEKVDYYKSIEKTLQKALVLAEKTADDTKEAANKEADFTRNNASKEADNIINEANLKARNIIRDAKDELNNIQNKSTELLQQFELYKAQVKQITKAQLDLIECDAFQVQKTNLSGLVSDEDNKSNMEVVDTRDDFEDREDATAQKEDTPVAQDPEKIDIEEEVKDNTLIKEEIKEPEEPENTNEPEELSELEDKNKAVEIQFFDLSDDDRG